MIHCYRERPLREKNRQEIVAGQLRISESIQGANRKQAYSRRKKIPLRHFQKKQVDLSILLLSQTGGMTHVGWNRLPETAEYGR